MDLVQGLILVVMCIVILADVRISNSFRRIGLVPLSVLGFVVLVSLFMSSPVLGIVGAVTLYVLFLPPQELPEVIKDECAEPQPDFKETLEEQIVKQVPGTQFN
jgi:Ca2+/Na+ antiporter